MLHPYFSSKKILFGEITEGEFWTRHHIKDAVSWENALLNETTFPELDQTADRILVECLGYFPRESVYLPFMPFLKALIKQQGSETISKEMIEHVKLIRNRDMQVGFWDRNLNYTDEFKEDYSSTLPHWRYAAKDYMSYFLGYEPPTRISFMAEVYLRKVLEDANNVKHLIHTGCFKAINIYKFRRSILDHSYEAALHSDLFFLKFQ